jgi:hypothetical protein
LTVAFWRTKGVAIIRQFFNNIFNVKPKDKDDYYSVLRWRISKKFAYALAILIGIVSLYYVLLLSPVAIVGKSSGNSSLPVYRYNSLAVRFYDGACRIKARDGHIAYEGSVSKGVVKGEGRLFDKEGELVYDGTFDKNMFNGEGKLYYGDGELKYEGAFQSNLMSGMGKLYAESGSLQYDGEFIKGKKNGAGTLYNAAATEIYKGNFVLDHIPYEEFVGKTAEEAAAMYLGKESIYIADGEFTTAFDEIDAVAQVTSGEDDIEGNGHINSITVLKDEFFFGGKSYKSLKTLEDYFGSADFSGYTYCLLTDIVAINRLPKESPMERSPIGGQDLFDNAYQVDDYDHNVEVYIHAFKKDKMLFTFYFTGSGEKNFFMYQIEVGE